MRYIIRCIWKKGKAPSFCRDIQSRGQHDTTIYGDEGRPRIFSDLNQPYWLLQQHDTAVGSDALDHYEVEEDST